jgi:putative protease
LNAPWQTAFFPNAEKLNLWAGPFCNIANPLGISVLAEMGFSGVIVSPELGGADYQLLPRNSPLPLGIVIAGNWPLCISRALADDLKTQVAFESPRGEGSWVQKYGSSYWVYPNWRLDLNAQRQNLETAGYCFFVDIDNPLPSQVKLKKRSGLWNWNIGLA